MSHSVTITRTTTSTSNSSYIVLNTGYVKTVPGLLKLLQLLLGIVCVGIIGYYFGYSENHQRVYNYYPRTSELFFFLMTVTFMIGTFCILLSCFCSLSTGSIISKTLYELVYHVVGSILLLAAGIFLIIETTDKKYFGNSKKYDAYLAASIIALANGILYAISAFYAHRSYRGI